MTDAFNRQFATDLILRDLMRRRESNLHRARSQIEQAVDMRGLVQAWQTMQHATPGALRGIVRSAHDTGDFKRAAIQKGTDIIDAKLGSLWDWRRCEDGQFLSLKGRFISEYRGMCRGSFPELYHHAQDGLNSLDAWRHQNIRGPEDTFARPSGGTDLCGTHHFVGVDVTELSDVREGGLRGAAWAPAPASTPGHIVLAALPNHTSDGSVSAEFLVVAGAEGRVSKDGSLASVIVQRTGLRGLRTLKQLTSGSARRP